ncbi:MAG: helix-turn-helix domain-containing protein [Mycobacterium sp.]
MQMRHRYRIEPTPAQQQILARVFGCCRVVFNDALPRRSCRGARQAVTPRAYFTNAKAKPSHLLAPTVWITAVSSRGCSPITCNV